jgi:ADP-heptose:LPS heptosyltransferase
VTYEGHGQGVVAIRPGALGDALLALPALAWLRRARPGTHVLFVAREDVLPLARATGLAVETSAYGSPVWGALCAEEEAGRAQVRALVADYQDGIAWMRDTDGAVERNLRALGLERAVVAPGRPEEGEQVHTALLLARGLAGLGIESPDDVAPLLEAMPALVAPPEDAARATKVWQALGLAAASGPVVALHAGSGGAGKRWPEDVFGRLAEEMLDVGVVPLLVEGQQDAEVTRAVLGAMGARADGARVARELSVGALAALLGRCDAYIGNDSGVTHLAGLAGTPTVALFGPSDPAQWAPLGRQVRTVRAATGRMEDIALEEALEALGALERLAKTSGRQEFAQGTASCERVRQT